MRSTCLIYWDNIEMLATLRSEVCSLVEATFHLSLQLFLLSKSHFPRPHLIVFYLLTEDDNSPYVGDKRGLKEGELGDPEVKDQWTL